MVSLPKQKRSWNVFKERRFRVALTLVTLGLYGGEQLLVLQRGQGSSIGTWLVGPTGVALAAPESHSTAVC